MPSQKSSNIRNKEFFEYFPKINVSECRCDDWKTDVAEGKPKKCMIKIKYFFSLILYTLAVPSGSFVPIFKIGAVTGRIIGELMQLYFPNHITGGLRANFIVPGGYAIVGAAAFAGAVTHSLSVCVMVYEMTGQITHIVPMMIAVLVANSIALRLQPSLYDSMILIKKLPHLPDIVPSNSHIHKILVEHFMRREMKYIWSNMNYRDLKQVLEDSDEIEHLPLVDNTDSMTLLGCIRRVELINLISEHARRKRWVKIITERRAQNINSLGKVTSQCESSSPEEPAILEKREHLNFKLPTCDCITCAEHAEGVGVPVVIVSSENEMAEYSSHIEKEKDEIVDFSKCCLDLAPFQLVERTSMPKAHSLLSLLGINCAYVTTVGKLVGVVGLKELGKAIEDFNAGLLLNSRSQNCAGRPNQDNEFETEVKTKLLHNRDSDMKNSVIISLAS